MSLIIFFNNLHMTHIFAKSLKTSLVASMLLLSLCTVAHTAEAADATGHLDSANSAECSVKGWAYDPDNSGAQISVHFYRDGAYGKGGTFIGGCQTKVFRSDVNSAYGISGTHGFDCKLPSSLYNQGEKNIYIHAIDVSGGPNSVIGGSPKKITCGTQQVSQTLTVYKSGTGAGTVTSNPAGITCGTTCSKAYTAGTVVTLTATPATGSTFAGWTGTCSGTGACTVSMSATKSVTAKFNTVTQGSVSVSGATIVSNNTHVTQGMLNGMQLDAPLVMVPGGEYWYASNFVCAGAIKHAQLRGSLNNPYSTPIWLKDTCQRNAGYFCTDQTVGSNLFTRFNPSLNDVVNLWLMGMYQIQGAEYLGIVHEENVGSFEPGPGLTRVGLAWSNDSGNTWKYLGRIISRNNDVSGDNIQGVPYIVKDGYLHLYFHDYPGSIAVARANLGSVIDAARAGHVGSGLWTKYYNGTWTQPGLGGLSTGLNIPGISHTQMVHSTLTNKYYMATTRLSWSGGNTYVNLHESADGVTWKKVATIADEPASAQGPSGGYQYCSLASTQGTANHSVGSDFYVYCMKFKASVAGTCGSTNEQNLYRWAVSLGRTAMLNTDSETPGVSISQLASTLNLSQYSKPELTELMKLLVSFFRSKSD